MRCISTLEINGEVDGLFGEIQVAPSSSVPAPIAGAGLPGRRIRCGEDLQRRKRSNLRSNWPRRKRRMRPCRSKSPRGPIKKCSPIPPRRRHGLSAPQEYREIRGWFRSSATACAPDLGNLPLAAYRVAGTAFEGRLTRRASEGLLD
jgi:hypothetical protein